jgi:DNA repair protein SbcD/Mre11
MKLLCAGDLHIGRRSSRLPRDADPREASAGAAWDALVSLALERRVDAVLLSGDVVDRDNRYFEAFGALEGGARRLAEAAIPVVAVAGNHDHGVLPALARSLGDGFTLLGEGGRWEACELAGGAAVRVAGWSFPAERVREADLSGFPAPRAGIFTIGLLHADLDAPGSPYAPVTRARLRALGADLWLLGHVHAPAVHAELQPTLLYPGSPQALDPGEPGPHGVWLVEISPERDARISPLPLSSVRYETVEVDADVDSGEALRERVAEAVRERTDALLESPAPRLGRIVCRVELVHACGLRREERETIVASAPEMELRRGTVCTSVDRILDRTVPKADLHALAAAADPPGVLARFLLQLEAGSLDARGERLLAELSTRVAGVRRANGWAALDAEPVAAAELGERAREQATRLLDAVLAGKGGR